MAQHRSTPLSSTQTRTTMNTKAPPVGYLDVPGVIVYQELR